MRDFRETIIDRMQRDREYCSAMLDEHTAELNRLSGWLKAIGDLPDVDADSRGWMVKSALAGEPAPQS